MGFDNVYLELSPDNNSIVGPNGNGKSSLVSAVRVGLSTNITFQPDKTVANFIQRGAPFAEVELEIAYADETTPEMLSGATRGTCPRPLVDFHASDNTEPTEFTTGRFDGERRLTTFLVRRLFPPRSSGSRVGQQYFVDGKTVTDSAYQSVLGGMQIDTDSYLQVLSQETADVMARMTHSERLKLFTGAISGSNTISTVQQANGCLVDRLRVLESTCSTLEEARTMHQRIKDQTRGDYEKLQEQTTLRQRMAELGQHRTAIDIEVEQLALRGDERKLGEMRAKMETLMVQKQKVERELEELKASSESSKTVSERASAANTTLLTQQSSLTSDYVANIKHLIRRYTDSTRAAQQVEARRVEREGMLARRDRHLRQKAELEAKMQEQELTSGPRAAEAQTKVTTIRSEIQELEDKYRALDTEVQALQATVAEARRIEEGMRNFATQRITDQTLLSAHRYLTTRPCSQTFVGPVTLYTDAVLPEPLRGVLSGNDAAAAVSAVVQRCTAQVFRYFVYQAGLDNNEYSAFSERFKSANLREISNMTATTTTLSDRARQLGVQATVFDFIHFTHPLVASMLSSMKLAVVVKSEEEAKQVYNNNLMSTECVSRGQNKPVDQFIVVSSDQVLWLTYKTSRTRNLIVNSDVVWSSKQRQARNINLHLATRRPAVAAGSTAAAAAAASAKQHDQMLIRTRIDEARRERAAAEAELKACSTEVATTRSRIRVVDSELQEVERWISSNADSSNDSEREIATLQNLISQFNDLCPPDMHAKCAELLSVGCQRGSAHITSQTARTEYEGLVGKVSAKTRELAAVTNEIQSNTALNNLQAQIDRQKQHLAEMREQFEREYGTTDIESVISVARTKYAKNDPNFAKTISAIENEIQKTTLRMQAMHISEAKIQQYKHATDFLDKSEQLLEQAIQRRDLIRQHALYSKHLYTHILESSLAHVQPPFAAVMRKFGAVGDMRLIVAADTGATQAVGAFDTYDIGDAQLVLDVAFKQFAETPSAPGAAVGALKLSQSGGERSMISLAFCLACHCVTKYPFRLIDEINQGMDAVNERVAHEVVCNLDEVVNGANANGTISSAHHDTWRTQIPLDDLTIGEMAQSINNLPRRATDTEITDAVAQMCPVEEAEVVPVRRRRPTDYNLFSGDPTIPSTITPATINVKPAQYLVGSPKIPSGLNWGSRTTSTEVVRSTPKLEVYPTDPASSRNVSRLVSKIIARAKTGDGFLRKQYTILKKSDAARQPKAKRQNL